MKVLSLWKGEIEAPFPLIRQIASEVAARHGLDIDDLIGPSRLRCIVLARQEAMWLVRQRTTRSLPSIGQFFNRHHTTVLIAIRRHEERRRRMKIAA